MGRAALFVHLVWATWRRLPLIDADVEARLHHAIGAKCVELRCRPLAIGGAADHVHLLVELDAATAVARLVGEVKGASSYLMTHRFDLPFRWQPGYGASTMAADGVSAARRYVLDQKRHHGGGGLLADWEVADGP